jgi:hypothetical protein
MNSSWSPIKLLLLAVFLLSGWFGSPNQNRAEGNSRPLAQSPSRSPDSAYFLNLPLIGKSFPPPPPVFGAETYNFFKWKINKANLAKVFWLRNAAFSWAAIEPTRPAPDPTYNWDLVNNAGLIDAYNHNLTVIAIIKDTPGWARMQKYSAYQCGPIDASALDEYAQFIYDLVARYSQPPYNIRYFELGNEPDVDPTALGTDYSPRYGCWGNERDPYYGGGYYAEMLKYAYPAVKAANPESQVLIGGLLLDCDPTHPPTGKNCLAAKFLEGILRNQGAAYFDILAFHGYSGYSQGKIIDETNQNFAARGGQIVGKVDFLHSVMAQYGVNKPLMMTETALNCWPTDECYPPNDTFLQLQADYVVSAYVRSWSLSLTGAIWYTLEDSGWQQTGLHTGQTSRPAYNAYVFMTNELKGATIGQALTQFAGLKGYQFTTPTKRIWVLWAPDGMTSQTITLPGNVSLIYDLYGNSIPVAVPITVLHPIYIEFLY